VRGRPAQAAWKRRVELEAVTALGDHADLHGRGASPASGRSLEIERMMTILSDLVNGGPDRRL